MAILTMLILPIHEHGIFLHLFVSSLISFINDLEYLYAFLVIYAASFVSGLVKSFAHFSIGLSIVY